ncbi:MAG: hypothetical protein V9G12_05200 [Microthrixaceae bacterium]
MGQHADHGFDGGTQRIQSVYVVRHAERIALGTPYTEVVKRVGEILQHPEIRAAEVVVDATGVGRAVFEMFRDARRQGMCGYFPPHALTITSGTSRGWNVKKEDLISKVLRYLEEGRLSVTDDLAIRDKIEQELRTFKRKMTKAGNSTFNAERESDHDDLVIAIAASVWKEHRRVTPRALLPNGEVRDRSFEDA